MREVCIGTKEGLCSLKKKTPEEIFAESIGCEPEDIEDATTGIRCPHCGYVFKAQEDDFYGNI
jgi:DNA-directed RNA polymerase subunit RPC12/RpoP